VTNHPTGFGDRQGDLQAGASFGPIGSGDRPAMLVNNPFGDR
jgi:hypothetical protein